MPVESIATGKRPPEASPRQTLTNDRIRTAVLRVVQRDKSEVPNRCICDDGERSDTRPKRETGRAIQRWRAPVRLPSVVLQGDLTTFPSFGTHDLLRCNSFSIFASSTANGTAPPSTITPLMNMAGVPFTPTRWPSR